MCDILRSLCLVMVLSLGKEAHAQIITIDVRDVSLKEVIEEISRQTNLDFIYRSRMLENTPKITLHAKNVSAIDLLNRVLNEQGLECSLRNNVCIINRKTFLVTGKVITE